MNRNTPPPTAPRRTAIAVAVAAALIGLMAGCGQASTSASSDPSTSSQPATSRPASSRPASQPHVTATSAPAPTTRMITNRGHDLAFHVIPGRLPAIVLDAGGGLDSSSWKDIAPVLAKTTGSEVISYDREGMGDSDEVPGPWKVQNAVSDLETGLRDLGATRVILVAHSEAGEIATYFARQHPDQLAGAVLVDASLPPFYTDTEIARIAAANQAQVDTLKGHPTTKAESQLLAVAADYVPAHKAYHKVDWPSDIPATVIASARTPFPTSPPDARAWRAAQADFAATAPNRRLVIAADSSHDIPRDDPTVIEAEVEAAAVRYRSAGA